MEDITIFQILWTYWGFLLCLMFFETELCSNLAADGSVWGGHILLSYHKESITTKRKMSMTRSLLLHNY